MRKLFATGIVLGLTGLVLVPRTALPQTCQDNTPRKLMLSNYLDTLINPPKGEDTEFYTVSGGIPNIMFVIDTSGSMERMTPDGPSSLGGGVYPAGHFLDDWTNSGQQTTAFTSGRVVGCTLDPVFNATANLGAAPRNAMIEAIGLRAYYSPCGNAVDTTAIGAAYRGHSTEAGGLDYAVQASVCPHYTSSDSQATGDAGFDPDYYPSGTVTGTETTSGSKNVFFARDLVFHDSNYFGNTYAYSTTLAFHHNFGKGWTDTTTYPAKKNSSTVASIDDFCDQQGIVMQGANTRAAVCKSCLKKAGWYYDGVILDGGDGKRYPSLWYTGNYLNFFPPKFIVAKKIVKDVIATQSKVRMALGHFYYPDSLSDIKNGGLALDKEFNPSCDHPDSSFDSNRGSYVNLVDALSFGGGTPLANALFDVGQYYHTPGLTWFGGTGKAALVSSSNKNSYAVCFSCQASSVVVISDGQPSPSSSIGNDGSKLPSAATTATDANTKYAGDSTTGIRGITKTTCPQCDNFSGTDDYKDNFAKVAWYMHNMDLRLNTEDTRDCQKNGGKQVLDVYTVGFGTSQMADAEKILSSGAKAGGGSFISADNTEKLRTGLVSILESINTRATSFSVATVSTLQTTSGRSVIVPRFEPSASAHFRGHLMGLDLYSEFVNTCDPKADGTGTGDMDCDGKCQSVFLQDKEGSFVLEDSLGNFVKTEGSTPSCKQAPKCATVAGKSCSAVGSTAAVPWWDAGEKLAGATTSSQWKTRTIWTVVDDSSSGAPDGKIDASDPVFQLQATDAVANKVIPYLALGGGTVCNGVASALATAGNAARAALVKTSQVECAKTIIRYVLGADVFNEQDDGSFPLASEDDLWDRNWMLGDIFHSSPVVVQPPYSRKGIICPNGLSNQCLQSLWATPTPNGEAGYDGYALSSTYVNRRQIVLVGANDGLVHAFEGGAWNGNPTPGTHYADADDPKTTAVDESLPPFNGYFDRGTGVELWAFLPPDMLPKIPLLVTSTTHHFFVDGTPMVRDVWVDGTDNGLGTSITAANDRKEAQEFHTVAVFSERRGGTHFFALDVTNATEAATEPKFLWLYPQPSSKETLEFGETYGDFLPRAPPIGPVRIEADSVSGAANANTPILGGVSYHERWVAFLNGGFDPQYLRGRGVHMVDVWTGEELFDFSYSPDTTKVENALRYPIPATVGMTGWGVNVLRASNETNEFFFDTATFGDAGGQLWALRFHVPGKLDGTTKLATNWVGGRIFQMGTQSQTCKLCAGQPFFYMTANIPLPENGAYRVYAGSGDRFNLLDTMGGTCGPDNIRACVLRGCTVTLDKTSNLLESAGVGSAARGLTVAACAAMTSDQTDSTISACEANAKAKIVISGCPSVASGGDTTTKDVAGSCTWTATGYSCAANGTNEWGSKLVLSDTSNGIKLGNMFYSLRVFDDTRSIFTTPTEAATYDTSRLWLNQTGVNASYAFTGTYSTDLVLISAADDAPASLATSTSPGWVIYYNHGPTSVADDHQYNVYWPDERTSSGTGTLLDIYWNTIQPATGEVISTKGTCDAHKCGQIEARRVARKYGANVTTGGLSRGIVNDSGVAIRASTAALLVPTQADQPTVFVNQAGQISVGLTAVNPERGATNVGQTDAIDPSQDYGSIEVSSDLHACRHAASDAAAVCK